MPQGHDPSVAAQAQRTACTGEQHATPAHQPRPLTLSEAHAAFELRKQNHAESR